MKSINKLAVAAILALSSASLASAATYYVSGSTAFRAADVSAEVALIGASNCKATYWGSSSLTGASQSVIESNDGTTTVFFNHFTGSIAGDEALLDNLTVTFGNATGTGEAPSAVTNTTPNATTLATGGNGRGSTSTPLATVSVVPNIVYSDVQFPTAKAIINSSNQTVDAHTSLNAFANSSVVGIIPFVFVINGTTDVYSKLSGLSMDPQKFSTVWGSAGTPLSFFTGSSTDTATMVYAIGRDIDSGTRATALAETGYTLNGSGAGSVNTGVVQFAPYDNATDAGNDTTAGLIGGVSGGAPSGTLIGALNGYPDEGTTIDGYDLTEGNGGYNSGGNLNAAVSTQFTGLSGTVLVTYLGVSDAQAALASGSASGHQQALLMSYNGSKFDPTTYSSAPAIEEGQYTFWGYETEVFTSASASVASTGGTSLKSELNSGIDELASEGVTINSMAVGRQADGELITAGNPVLSSSQIFALPEVFFREVRSTRFELDQRGWQHPRWFFYGVAIARRPQCLTHGQKRRKCKNHPRRRGGSRRLRGPAAAAAVHDRRRPRCGCANEAASVH